MKLMKILGLLSGAALLFSACEAGKTCESADEMMKNLKVGWNLGCSLSVYTEEKSPSAEALKESYEDVCEFETWWLNPLTTKEMIHAVKERGFNAVRAQVSFYNHMDEEGHISEAFMKRVREVVDYCIDEDMYIIINTSGLPWLKTTPDDYVKNGTVYVNLWTQIAEEFKNTGDKLIFESFNEIRDKAGRWENASAKDYDVVNAFYRLFVTTVRNGGGYNKTRNLMLNTYAGSFKESELERVEIPADTVDGHLILQVHCYDPVSFTFNEENLGNSNFTWKWGSDSEKKRMDDIFDTLKDYGEKLGVPVVIGEFGVCDRTEESERAEYIRYYAEASSSRGIKLILFDDGSAITVFDRANCTWKYPAVVDALFDGIKVGAE